MNLLLDTCVLIWSLQEPGRLSSTAVKALKNSSNSVFVSSISFWEISLKASLGKLFIEGATPEEFPGFVREAGWEILSLDDEMSAGFGRLSRLQDHKDPFDRMLVWISILRGYHLVSRDRIMKGYEPQGLKICW